MLDRQRNMINCRRNMILQKKPAYQLIITSHYITVCTCVLSLFPFRLETGNRSCFTPPLCLLSLAIFVHGLESQQQQPGPSGPPDVKVFMVVFIRSLPGFPSFLCVLLFAIT